MAHSQCGCTQGLLRMRSGKSAKSEHSRREPGLAAAYVRMSTEHQQYSTENQLDTIKVYAAAHSLEIVKIYTDAGKSGLRLEGRDALIQLFSDVESDVLGFSTILVYDVSRWGAFKIRTWPPASRSVADRQVCRFTTARSNFPMMARPYLISSKV